MCAPCLSVLATSTCAGIYTSAMEHRMVFLAEPPRTKFLPTVSKAAFEPRGLCSSLRLIVYLALHPPQPSVKGG